MTMTAGQRADPRYLIVFGACVIQFTMIGLLFGNGLLIKVYEVEFGWSRTLVASASSLSMLMMGVFAILAGRLNDRFGPRPVLIVSGIVYGLGYVLLSQISVPWQLFVVFGLFVAAGISTHDVVTLSVIARWFERRRGMMTGVVKVGTAVGQIMVPLIMALLIAGLGWRRAVLALGLIAAVMLVAAAMTMRMPPAVAPGRAEARHAGMTFAEARRSRVFWTICAIQFLFFPTLTTVPLHIVPHGMDMGLSAPLAAVLLSVSGGASIAGRLTVGIFSDRIGGRSAYMLCFAPLIASLLAFLVIDVQWMLFGAIAVYGFAHGGFFTLVSPTIAEYFGMRAHSSIFGIVLFCGTVGGAIGPVLAGWVFDTQGSYTWAFATLAVFALAGLGLALSLPGRRPAPAVLPEF